MNGYIILIVGDYPHYRAVWCDSQKHMLSVLPRLKATVKGKIEVLHMVDGDTANAFREDAEADISD